MKTIKTSVLLIIALAIQMSFTAFASTPEQLSYQAVIKDASNNLVVSHAIGLKISILQTTSTGTAVYVETHSTTSNSSGLISVAIGTGTVVSGTFTSIDWSTGTYFIKSEIDPAGGTTYSVSGTTQLQSVPYALHAKTVDGAFSGSYNDLTNKPAIANTQWTTTGSDIYYNTGNIGIGTTTPSAKLSVLSTTEWGGMTVKGGTTADGSTIGLSNSNGLGNYSLGVYGSANTGSIANNFYVYDNVASAVRMTIASTGGNVGIGTTTPAYNLDVSGAINGTSVLVNGVPVASSHDTYWSANGGGKISYNGGNVGIGTVTPLALHSVVVPSAKATVTGNVASFLSTNDATNPFGLRTMVYGAASIANRYVSFQTTDHNLADGGNLIMQAGGGNVGIGTTTPSFALGGGLQINNSTRANLNLSNGTNTISIFQDGVDGYFNNLSSGSIVFRNTSSNLERMRIDANGNVGIGTTAPASKLHIAGADMNNALLFENTSANPGRNYILFKTQGTEQGYIGLGGGITNHMSVAAYGASNNLYLETNSLARMTILPSGNVGIGTTTPGYKLHVAGGAIGCQLGSNGVSGAFVGGGSDLQIYHSASTSVYFWNTASGKYEFYDAGGSTSTGTLVAGAYTTGSDRRLKNNIVNTLFGINDLMKIQVRDYVYKADTSKTLVTGFIAQELFEIFPNAVTKPAKAEDMWSVDYGKVTPLLVKAIQDLKKTNDTQKLTNDAQQKQIDSQQSQIDALTKLVEGLVKK